MDFEVSHEFNVDPATLAEVLIDEEYQRSLHDVGALKNRELLAQDRGADGEVTRRVRCVLDVRVSGLAKSILGSSEPAWVEHARWRPNDSRWDWEIHPEVAPDLLDARGYTEIKESDRGSIRVVKGRVKVKVPLYGGKVEGWIVDGIERAYEEEAERLQEWFDRLGS